MSRGLHVLHVEDNPQNRRLLARVATAVGWELEEAPDGVEALERLARPPAPDLILLDLALPELDGYQVTRRIRGDPELAWIPVVALTAHAMVGDEERARGAGCDAYLTKPIDVRRFPGAMERLLVDLGPRRAARRLAGIEAGLAALAAGGAAQDLPERLVRAAEALLDELGAG